VPYDSEVEEVGIFLTYFSVL